MGCRNPSPLLALSVEWGDGICDIAPFPCRNGYEAARGVSPTASGVFRGLFGFWTPSARATQPRALPTYMSKHSPQFYQATDNANTEVKRLFEMLESDERGSLDIGEFLGGLQSLGLKVKGQQLDGESLSMCAYTHHPFGRHPPTHSPTHKHAYTSTPPGM